MSTARWLDFYQEQHIEGRKTDRWLVFAKGGGQLGQIRWYSGWRKYAFFPHSGTLYEPTCLRDIAAFIDGQMLKRKQGQ